MRRSNFSKRQRSIARFVLVAVLHQWLVPQVFAATAPPAAEDAAPLPLASTVTAIAASKTASFIDATLIGTDASELVGKWIRLFTEDSPAGLITQITAFDSATGKITLQDQLPAGAVNVNDVYHLAESREVLLPTSVDPSKIGLGSVGCKPKGTGSADNITCLAIDSTGVDAGKGNDTVSVTKPTIVLVTKFGSDKKDNPSEKDKADATDEATAIDLGEGNDRIVNDGTIVSAAISVVSEAPKSQPDESKKTETKAAAKAEPKAIGIDGGDGSNVITNNGTLSTSATALLLARQIPGETDNQKNTDVSTNAEATSTAINGGDGGSFITNTGRLASRAIAVAAGLGISTSTSAEKTTPAGSGGSTAQAQPAKDAADKSKDGEFIFKGDVTATATASGIALGTGTDTVTNTGDVIVTGSANTAAFGATQIKAKGSAGATAKAESTSTANGVTLGDGNDTLINTGTLTVNATSRALSIELAIADKNNESTTTPTPGNGNGNGIGTGNQAAPAKKPEPPTTLSSSVDGTSKATATASGITADTGEAKPESEPIFKIAGNSLTVGRESTETRPGGNDSVNNSGTIDVNATARTVAGAGGLTVDGSATVKANSEAAASALAVDLGAGNDRLTNSGTITTVADSVANALAIAVAQKASKPSTPPSGGTTAAAEEPKNTIAIKTDIDASATAESIATGIAADGALATKNVKWQATISLAPSLDFTRETQTTQATGADTVTNSGLIGVVATATTRAGSAGISADGAAAVNATSTTRSTAQGIDLGNGDDTLTNTATGQLNTSAIANADALSLAIGFKSDPSVKAEIETAATVGATATATATGVSADGLTPDSASALKLGVSKTELSLEFERKTTLAGGNDVVTNNGAITTGATATTTAIGIAFSVDGKATANAKSEATADAGAIDLGAGHDTLTNTGTLNAIANATTTAIGVAIGAKGDSKPTTPPGGQSGTATAAADAPVPVVSTVNAGAASTADAIGITGDGLLAEKTERLQLQIGGGPSFLAVNRTTTHAGGNDTVTNSGTISAAATAVSRALDGSVKQDDKSAAAANSTAQANAAGVDLGAGHDTLTSTGGSVTATADATASALSVAIGVKSDPKAKSTAESAVDARVTAEARAVGISSDALQADFTVGLRIQHIEGVLSVNAQVSETRASGQDAVTNAADVTSTATAASRDGVGAIAVDGSTAAKTTSTATAEAAGIDLGGGNDILKSNTGDIVTNATATVEALALAIGVEGSSSSKPSAPAGGASAAAEKPAASEKPKPTAADTKAAVDASLTANATAIGITADSLRPDSTFTAALSLPGLRPQLEVEVAHTRPSGDDTVTNDGAITTSATATSTAIAAGVGIGGDVTVKSSSTANAIAAGIDLGGGHDTLVNNGMVTTTATAEADAINATIVSKASGGSTPSRAKSSIDANATAEARATGLAADSTAGDGELKVKLAVGDNLFSGVVFGLSLTDARASGNDIVTNTGQIEARASATTVAAGIGLTAEGTSSVMTSSTADGTATAIDLGAGADRLTNEGRLLAMSSSIAAGLNISFTNKGRSTSTEGFFAPSEGLWKGGIESNAMALGIDASGAAAKSTKLDVVLNGIIGVDVRFEKLEDGVSADLADRITNTGSIHAEATSATASINVAATAEGFAGAVSDLDSKALAVGVRGGQGDDVIENFGLDRVTSVIATALTGGVTVAVSAKGSAVAVDTLWSSGTEAQAAAVGVDGDGGILKSKTITFVSDLSSGQLVIDKRETGGSGNDTITNQQTIQVIATSLAPSLGVAFTAEKGVAATVSTVDSTADATGIRGGGGDDLLTNSGMLLVGATALAAAANVAISKGIGAIAGGAIWDGGTKAEATSIGIDGDGVSTKSTTLRLAVNDGGVTKVREQLEDAVTGAGADTIKNSAAISVNVAAESDSAAVAGSANGVTVAFGQSTAESTAAAIRGGAGNDSITNSAKLDSTASSIARALNVSVVADTGGAIAGNDTVWQGGTAAKAKSSGIAGDGGSIKKITVIGQVESETPASGDDSIKNTGEIDVKAEATTRALAVPVAIQGAALGVSTSTAEAAAAAIDAGGGTDAVTNNGLLKSTATAAATTANVAFTNLGLAGAADAVWNGGTKAHADSTGIAVSASEKAVTNSGAIEATSNATTGSLNVAVAIQGVAAAVGTSTATAQASGIQVGQGNVTNTGALTINANALAGTANVSVTTLGLAASVDSVWNGGTTATARAKGIGGGADSAINGGRIESSAAARTGAATVAVAVEGVAAAIGTASANADASAIELRDGPATTLINRGKLIADALALAGTVNVSVTMGGVTVSGNDVWDGGTKAEATTRAIKGGSGDDAVTNAGEVTATSDATTVSVPVSVAVSGLGVAIGTSTATSIATAIDADLGNNTVANRDAGITDRTGKLTAEATANAVTANVAVTTLGGAVASDAVWNGGTTGDARARGIRTATGNDTIDNGGAIDATSTARSGSANVAVAVTGVAVALANSTSISKAAGIDSGAVLDGTPPLNGPDNDILINRGLLTVNANAFALSLPVAVTTAGVAVAGNSVWDGGTTAEAAALGITAGAGDDLVGNHGTVTADADATSGSIGVSVAVTGVAAAVATSTANATAGAIDAGDGVDRVSNTGKVTADATALAGTVTVAVTTAGVAVAGDAVWDGGTKANAAARTIAAGSGADRVRNEGDVKAVSTADTASVAVTVAVAGVGASVATSTSTSIATAIDLGAGDDTIVNTNGGQTDRTGKLTADATANAVAASVTVTPAGVAISSDAVWRGGTTATATAAGIDAAAGKDTVFNAAEMDVDSTARTGSVSAAITVFGVSAALVNSTATASGAGIKTGVRDDSGNPVNADSASESDSVFNTGKLVIDVDALATSLGIGFSFGGMAGAASNLWDGGTTSNAYAWGIGLGAGNDDLVNSGIVDIASFSNAVSASLGVTVFGVSAASSTATANARSSALDGGAGNDIITNLAAGTLTSDATATGVGVNASFVAIGATAAGDTVWNGGTKADVIARGIDGAFGNDVVTNDGTIAAKADSTTVSVAVSITGIGVGAAAATSTSTATAMGIDGGDGGDTITNRGNTTATSLSSATGVKVAATGIGAGAAFDSFNGGTAAIANATGLAGGAGDDTVTHLAKTVTANASSDTLSTSVSVTLLGPAFGTTASTSTANATAVDGGAGADGITVDSTLVSTATSTAAGNNVTVSSLSSVSGGFDTQTKAESTAIGVKGGDDADTITLTDKSTTTLTSTATTKDAAVAVTLAIVGAADSQAVSTANAAGVAGGGGNDTINHDGATVGTLTAESKSRAVAINAIAGVANGDASGRSQVTATGIDGGQGDDGIVNRGSVDLTGTATARGNSFSFAGIGVADADAVTTSTASITGLQGGEGTDTVTNALGATVKTTTTAQTIASSKALTLAVAGRSDAQATPTATAAGLDGGAGDDVVVNIGTVDVNSHATSSATGWSLNLIGGTSTTAGTQATANAFGLGGGLGNDTVRNRSLVIATAFSEASVDNSSWTLAGAANTSSIFNATGLAAGITGGAGADQLHNDIDGSLSVFFTSKLTAKGGSTAIFGSAKDNTQLTAGGSAVGIAGDADNDLIQNRGFIDVNATAGVTATKASVTFIGAPKAAALLSAHATATGLDGGTGNDDVSNDADVLVRATGTSKLSGGVDAKLTGSGNTSGTGTANATATGLDGGDGDNAIRNGGVVDLLAFGNSDTSNSSSAGILFNVGGVPSALSTALSTVNAFGIAAGAGNNAIDNNVSLKATANASGYSYAYSSGAHIAVNGPATATANVTATATARGISALGGANSIFNRGLLAVSSLAGTARLEDSDDSDTFCSTEVENSEEPLLDENGNQVLDEDGNPVFQSTTGKSTCVDKPLPSTKGLATYAAANGNGAVGVGRATSRATTQADAFGVQVGDGANTVVNLRGGEVTVTAQPSASVTAFADGDLKAQAFGTGAATARATAVGIQAGNGQNTIVNSGSLTVLAEPTARASVDVTTAATICINFFFGTWCGGGGLGFADATATVNASAVGIDVGDGDNMVVNDGLLSVTAAPGAGTSISITHADSRTRKTTVTASAIGIQTGSGNNTILNTENGVVDVEAKYTPACSGVTCDLTLTAVGIKTGSGDDTIDNEGVLSAATTSSGGTTFTTAIDAGSGNDRVVLGPGSQTKGNVLLGAGNDRLVWGSVASLTGGTVNPGSGSNTFALGGSVAGSLNLSGSGPIGGMNVFTAFNDFRKEGGSTWTLTGTRAMNWTVEDGTLAIGGSITGTIATQTSNVLTPTVAVNAPGIVTSPGAAPAVLLQTNGALVNDGKIVGNATGVQVAGMNGLIVNNGSITATGIAVQSTGSQNVIVNDGLISGGTVGVALGSGDSLTNNGTISSITGLAIQGGIGTQSVANSGVLTGGAGVALDLGGGDDELTIVGNSVINGVSNGGDGNDTLVLGGSFGTLDASTVAAAFKSFENISMQAAMWTVVGTGSLDVTVNHGLLNVTSDISGTLETSATSEAALIFVGSTGSVINDDHTPAVVLAGPNTLINSGVIDSPVAAAGNNSSVLNVGAIVTQSGAAIAGGAGAQNVENHGVIASGSGPAIDLGAGDDTLSLGTTARLGGQAEGGSGFDTLNLTGSGGVQLGLNSFANFELLNKEGDSLWLLTGSNAMAWHVRAGTLVLNGQLAGPGVVEQGGLFAGNGTVGSLTNEGTVAPGMSIGKIAVAGDFTQTSTGVLEIEGSIVTDFADRLNVGGRATLGGALAVRPESRPFGIATEYTILEAQGGVTGAFDSATSSTDHLDAYVDYLPTSVNVALVRDDISFKRMAGTGNLQGFGAVLDASKRSMARGDFKGVMDEFVTMDETAQTSALRSLSGELHASLPSTLLRTGERFFSASTTRRVSAEQTGDRVAMWTDYLRFDGDVSGVGGTAGLTYGVSGLVGGVDFAIGRSARLGGSLGFARTRSELDRFASDGAVVRSRMPAVYGQYATGPVLVEGTFGHGEHNVRTARLIELGSVRRQSLANYTAEQYSGLVRVSVAVPTRAGVAVTPFIETRHSQVTRHGFDETGAGSVSLVGVKPLDVQSLRTLVGLRATSASRLFGTRVEPSFSLAWTREGMDRHSGMQAALTGMTTRPGFQTFTLNGAADARNGALINAGTSVVIASRGRAFVSYDGLLTDMRTEHSIATGLRMAW